LGGKAVETNKILVPYSNTGLAQLPTSV